MRYAANLTFALAVGLVACEVTINKGANDPNAATATTPPATGATAATTTPTATPTAPVTPGAQFSRIRPGATTPAPTSTGTNVAANPLPPPSAPVIQGNNDFGTGTASADSLMGQVFFIPPATQKFPDVSTIKPTATLYAKQLDIAPRRFDAGFPGIDNRFEWFAIRYTGTVNVVTPGAWQFHTLCDDGCNVYIDGTKVLDNDGVHPPQHIKQTVQLTAGQHSVQVDYFQGPRYDLALQFWVTPPGGNAERLFTTSL